MPKKKITDAQKNEIFEKIIEGKTYKEISKEYDVIPQAIYYIYSKNINANEIEYFRKIIKTLKELVSKSEIINNNFVIMDKLSENAKKPIETEIDKLYSNVLQIKSKLDKL